jgi:hypothetical protein
MEVGMIVEYEFRWQCLCPVDHKPDVYRTVVRSGRAIPVEDILKAAAAIAEREAGTPVVRHLRPVAGPLRANLPPHPH